MSEEYVYTYSDIKIEPYKFEKIMKIKVIKKINEHAQLVIEGIISDEMVDEYVENADKNANIKVSVENEDNINTIFEGIVVNISISCSNNVRTLVIEAMGNTILMDIKIKSRTFQRENESYYDIFRKINKSYNDAQIMDSVTNGKNIDKLIVQYQETDWEFLKRLASHFNVGIIPESHLSGIKYSLWESAENKLYDIKEINYSIEKGLHEFNENYENGNSDLIDIDFISYEITTNLIMNLTSKVKFKDKVLYVYSCSIEMENGVLLNKYILRSKNGLKVKKIYNTKIVGVSLQGRVLDTKNDRVKISLEIDGSPTEKNEIRWFEFATIFSSPDGTGWYCMPEIYDVIRLYFPDCIEKNAYVISSMHYQTTMPNKRCDPSIKSIGTKYGKEIIMKKGEIDIIANKNLVMKMTDNGGIEVNSDKKIIFNAGDDIEINAASININGASGINLIQSGAKVIIKDDVIISGGKVNIQS